ncbi:MAG: putative signal transducing protein [Thermoanaerobaculia bacterium]
MTEKREELPYQTVEGEGMTWVEIASTGTQDEAALLKGFLDAEGIPAQIENVKFSMEPINFGTMGDIRIYVAREDQTRAMELLKSRERQYDKLDDDSETLVTDEGPAEIDENARADTDEK